MRNFDKVKSPRPISKSTATRASFQVAQGLGVSAPKNLRALCRCRQLLPYGLKYICSVLHASNVKRPGDLQRGIGTYFIWANPTLQ